MKNYRLLYFKKKRNIRFLFIFFIAVLATGCSHQFMRGTVVMKSSQNRAHICLGDNDVQLGDKVEFYKNICSSHGVPGIDDDEILTDCKMQLLGTGVVSKIINSHYSEIKTKGNFSFSEGTLVQKVQ